MDQVVIRVVAIFNKLGSAGVSSDCSPIFVIRQTDPSASRRSNLTKLAASRTRQSQFTFTSVENSHQRSLLRTRRVVRLRRKVCGAVRQSKVPAKAVPIDSCPGEHGIS